MFRHKKTARSQSPDDPLKENSFNNRQKRLAYGISEAWRRTLANRDSRSSCPKNNDQHPKFSTKRLKHEVKAILEAEESSINNAEKLHELVRDALMLLFEAELHKSTLSAGCERLKEQFERDANIIRDLHAKQNVPIAITNTLLDTRYPLLKAPNAENSSSLSSVKSEECGNDQ
ncbi:unnamed protein product [Strongylus vulgaris]|uniref:Uncharacterized protein n=1 Tax=Strongylus vulgaris TaxID=40348 RepID=A0A3P7IK57_STRVU|nr:unnamed protein product [Strongylus vulgaris]